MNVLVFLTRIPLAVFLTLFSVAHNSTAFYLRLESLKEIPAVFPRLLLLANGAGD
jgi:hypothetical protein